MKLALSLSFIALAACADDTTSKDSSVTDAASEVGDSADSAIDAGADTSPDSASDVEPDVDQDTLSADTTSDTTEAGAFVIIDQPTPVDLTPDGMFAIFWDGASDDGDTYIYDVELKTLKLETSVGTPARDFPTAVSSDLQITALHGEPVQAGLWTSEKTWRDLGSVYADGCGEDPEDATRGDIGGAWDVSADGKVVVGLMWNDCTAAAFRWSDDGETTDLRALDVLGAVSAESTGVPNNRATVVSDDGLVAAGFAQTELVDRWPAIWQTGSGEGFLLETDQFTADSPGEILAIETDGKSAVGVWNLSGFVWSETGGVVAIGALPDVLPGEPTYANVIAAHGTLVFGTSGGGSFGVPNAFVWTAAGGMKKLADIATASGVTLPADVLLTNVLAASSDGSVLLGTLQDTNTFAEKSFILRLPPSVYTTR